MNGFQLIDPGLSLFENLFLPTLAWSVVVGFVFLFIHFLFTENPGFQTQIRILLLWTLPAAIFINFILNTQFVQSKPDFIVIPDNILILNTDTIEPVPAEIAEASPDIYEQIKALTGWISGLTILIGFSYFTGYLLLFHRLARYHQYLILIPENEVIKLILLENDLISKVTVYQSNGFVTPFTFGFSHPKIIIPEKYCSDPVQFQLILRHEVSHIRNHDYLKQMGEQALKFLFFWNPLLHLLTRQISNYREMACDEQVLSVCPDWKKEYATLLLTHLSEPAASTGVAAAMSHSTENLKERISKMKTYQTIRENKTVTGVLAGVLTAFSVTFILLISNAKLEAVEAGNSQSAVASKPDSLNRDYPELVGGLDALAGIQNKIKYPEFASRKGIEGLVVLSLKVSEKGEVEDISVAKSTGSASLDAQAVVAAQELRFKPALKDGKAVTASVQLPVQFKLDSGKKQEDPLETDGPAIEGGMSALLKNLVYPEEAFKKGIEGTVLVGVYISETGDPMNTEIEKSVHPLLDRAAQDAVFKVKFIPGRKDGKPVSQKVTIPFKFKIPDNPKSGNYDGNLPEMGHIEIEGGFPELYRNLVYPPSAKAKGIQGKAIVEVSYSESGEILSVSIKASSGNTELDQAAIEAVKKTKLKITPDPDGKTHSGRYGFPVEFKLTLNH